MLQILLVLSMVISLVACDQKEKVAQIETNKDHAVEQVTESIEKVNSELLSSKKNDQTNEKIEIEEVPAQEADKAEKRQETRIEQSEPIVEEDRVVKDKHNGPVVIKNKEVSQSETSTAASGQDGSEDQQMNNDDEIVLKEEIELPSLDEEVPIESVIKEENKEKTRGEIVDDIHGQWQELLQKHVSSRGVVNYLGLKMEEDVLDTYLTILSDNAPSTSDLSNDAKAFWINAYNAFTVKLILDHYPVKSIRDIAGGEPWDKKWIKLGSKVYSLNNIEHDILRPTWKDARIHFAVNCAAKSCPPLGNKAFTASNTDALLEKLTKSFVNNTTSNTITSSSLVLSKIFDWYKADFGDLAVFIDKYTTVEIPSDVRITYQDYDWSLNGK